MTAEEIPATEADVKALSQVIADAFRELAVSQWLIPDQRARADIFPAYFQLYVEHAMHAGQVFTTPDRDAVGLWITVGEEPPPPPEGYEERLAAVTGQWHSRFPVFDAILDEHHPRNAPHQHLAILGVHPGKQRSGLGSALLTARHAALDIAGTPAYLEASGLDTRELYLRHGYTDLGSPIQLPDGPAMYPMWRAPR